MDGESIPQRKRGRPRIIKDSAASVTTWISTRHHERLSSIARRHDRSVSSVVRRAIFLFLKDDNSGPSA